VPKSKIIIVWESGRFLGARRLGLPMSVLAKRLEDPALSKLVLAYDALGVDPQQHVDAVPGPLGHLGRVDAAVEPCGQAGVPEVIRAPSERRGLLRGTQRRLARFDPGAGR
jgi:hypothetical protein